jgi:hypothetical protein
MSSPEPHRVRDRFFLDQDEEAVAVLGQDVERLAAISGSGTEGS